MFRTAATGAADAGEDADVPRRTRICRRRVRRSPSALRQIAQHHRHVDRDGHVLPAPTGGAARRRAAAVGLLALGTAGGGVTSEDENCETQNTKLPIGAEDTSSALDGETVSLMW